MNSPLDNQARQFDNDMPFYSGHRKEWHWPKYRKAPSPWPGLFFDALGGLLALALGAGSVALLQILLGFFFGGR